MSSVDYSKVAIVEKPFHTPPLDEIVQVLSSALKTTFEYVSVSAEESPDLTKEPYGLTSPGLCGDAKLIELGGPPYLVPSVRRDKVYDLAALTHQLRRDPAFLVGAGAGPWPYVGVNCEGIINLSVRGGSVEQGTRVVSVHPPGAAKGSSGYLQQRLPRHETRTALLGNYLLSDGSPGKVGVMNLSVERGTRVVSVHPPGAAKGSSGYLQQRLPRHETRTALLGNYLLSDGSPGKVGVMNLSVERGTRVVSVHPPGAAKGSSGYLQQRLPRHETRTALLGNYLLSDGSPGKVGVMNLSVERGTRVVSVHPPGAAKGSSGYLQQRLPRHETRTALLGNYLLSDGSPGKVGVMNLSVERGTRVVSVHPPGAAKGSSGYLQQRLPRHETRTALLGNYLLSDGSPGKVGVMNLSVERGTRVVSVHPPGAAKGSSGYLQQRLPRHETRTALLGNYLLSDGSPGKVGVMNLSVERGTRVVSVHPPGAAKGSSGYLQQRLPRHETRTALLGNYLLSDGSPGKVGVMNLSVERGTRVVSVHPPGAAKGSSGYLQQRLPRHETRTALLGNYLLSDGSPGKVGVMNLSVERGTRVVSVHPPGAAKGSSGYLQQRLPRHETRTALLGNYLLSDGSPGKVGVMNLSVERGTRVVSVHPPGAAKGSSGYLQQRLPRHETRTALLGNYLLSDGSPGKVGVMNLSVERGTRVVSVHPPGAAKGSSGYLQQRLPRHETRTALLGNYLLSDGSPGKVGVMNLSVERGTRVVSVHPPGAAKGSSGYLQQRLPRHETRTALLGNYLLSDGSPGKVGVMNLSVERGTRVVSVHPPGAAKGSSGYLQQRLPRHETRTALLGNYLLSDGSPGKVGVMNLSVERGTRVVSVHPPGAAKGSSGYLQQRLPRHETRTALLGNYLLSDGSPGKVIKVVVKKRIGESNFITAIREALKQHYGDKVVGLGGLFVLRAGAARHHVMPDFSPAPLCSDAAVDAWLHYFELPAPIAHVGTLVTGDLGLDLRVQHFHGWGARGEGGHYHRDTTPDAAEYEGYFSVAGSVVRVDAPSVTHTMGRD